MSKDDNDPWVDEQWKIWSDENDISKIEDLGFSCSVNLTDGLSKTIDWYQKNFDALLRIENKTY